MEIWRGGVTTGRIRKVDREITLRADGAHASDQRSGLRLNMDLRYGKGESAVILWFGPGDFKQIARKMMAADPKAASRAFLEALLAHAEKR